MTAEDILNCSFKDRKKSHHDTGMGSMKYSKGMRSLDKTEKNPFTSTYPIVKKFATFAA